MYSQATLRIRPALQTSAVAVGGLLAGFTATACGAPAATTAQHSVHTARALGLGISTKVGPGTLLAIADTVAAGTA